MTGSAPGGVKLTEEMRKRLAQLSPAQRALLEQKLGIAAERVDVIPRRAEGTLAPLTAGQELLWTLQNALPETFAYNVPRVLAVTGPLDVSALRDALSAFVARHDILRTRFVATPDGPRQVVDGSADVTVEVVDLREAMRDQPQEAREGEVERLSSERIRTPFDLAAGPQLLATVFRLGDAEWRVVLVFHHITSDEASRDILFRELALLYDAARAQRVDDAVAALPRIDVPFGDFAAWQQKEIEGGSLREQISYWRERLAGLSALELPTDRPRTATPSFAGARHRTALGANVRAGVMKLARDTGASPFMVLLAAAQAVLHRYTGQRDISVGTPVAGRERSEVEHIVGYFPSAVVLRTEVDPELSFSALLARVRETVLGAFDNQDVPVERLLAELTDREDAQGPLFRVAVQMASGGAQPPRLGDADVRIVATDVGTAKFDLFIGFEDGADGLRLMLEYRTDLFDAPTIERMAAHIATLLEAVVADPALTIAAAPLLAERERQLLLHDWAGERVKYAGGATLVELLSAQAAATPDAVAVEDERRTMTFAELDGAASALAHALRDAGVGRDVRVGVCADRSVELVVALAAVVKAGGAYVPFDPEYPLERLAFMMEDAGVGALLTTQALAPTLPPCAAPVILLDGVAELPANANASPLPVPHAADPAYLIFTSGSTGRPKGALNAHRGIVNRLQWMQSEYELTGSDVVLQKTPFSFDVSVWEFFWPLLAGAKLVMAQPGGHRDTGYLADTIVKHGVTVCHFVPSMLRAFLADPAAARCTTLRDVMASGEALAPDLVAEFHRVLPAARLHNLYGPTECGVDVSYWPCPQSDVPPAVVPIGKPVSNTRLYVLDALGEPTPIGVSGELFLAGVQVGLGYHNRPELTAERFVRDRFAPPGEGPHARMYRTGDRARWLASGDVEYLGRLDFQVKIRGFRIELGEVEASLLRHPQVRDCVVVARTDDGEQRLVAYLVAADEAPTDAELRALLLETLPEYMVPSAFAFLDALPLSSNGKVDRRTLLGLPAPEGAASAARAVHRAPRTATERALVDIWSSVLKRDTLGVDDDFFALGGHSLLAMRMLGKIIERFGVRLPLRTAFERRTIAAIARAVEAARAEAPPAPIAAIAADVDAPLSYGQELLWLVQRSTPELSVYNIPVLWHLHGSLDVDALRSSVAKLAERHHALRSIVVGAAADPKQRLLASAPLLVVEDLSHVSAETREDAARRRVEELSAVPFDLSSESALRVTLLRLSETEHALLLLTHHAIADGWSVGILVRELSALYDAAVRGHAASLPDVAVQYRDFAAWQRATMSAESLAGELAWWRTRLLGAPSSLELPTDRPRSTVMSFEGGRRMRVLPRVLLDRLRALAAHEGATLYSVLGAAYAVLLHRYTSQADVVIGTVVANRPRADLEHTVGYFANTIPLRVSLADAPTFAEVVKRVHDAFLEASEHADVPFEQLALELHDGTRPSDPLVQAMFLLQNNEDAPLTLGEATVEKGEIGAVGAKVELTLSMTERPDGLRTVLQFRRALFDDATIERMLDHLGALLESAAERPATPVNRLRLLTAEERALVTTGFNDTAAPLPEWNVPQKVAAQARAFPASVAVRAADGSVTYGELERRAGIVAGLLGAASVRAGDRVAICLDRTTTLPTALLGVLRMGLAYVPIDPSYPSERIEHVLSDAGVTAVLTDARSRGALPAGTAKVIVLGDDTWLATGTPAAAADVGAEETAYVLYTSGSTGKPKGVEIPHRALANFLASMADRPGLAAGDAVVAVTTIAFDIAGLELWLPLVTGATVVLASRDVASDGRALRAEIERTCRAAKRVLVQATPATWLLLVEAGWQGAPNVVILCGGEAWPASLAGELIPRSGALWNVYGPTETTIWSTRDHVTTPGPVSLGEPLANTTLYVLEPTGEPAPLGVPGELLIGGAGLAHGYHGRPDLTADRFITHPEFGRLYRTGDLVRRAGSGTLAYLGRMDDQVKVRGYRIELGDVEAALASSPDVAQAAATVHRAESGEARLAGYVVFRNAPSDVAAALDAVRARMRDAVPEYMVPSAIMALDALPLTPNGKVNRRALPVPTMDDASAAFPYVAPRNELEETIAGVWGDVLGIERVGVTQDFFALGGHSLLAMRVVARLADATHTSITISDLFDSRTVETLALRLAKSETTSARARTLADVIAAHAADADRPLTRAQEVLWVHSQLAPESGAYNVPIARRLRGDLDAGSLANALRHVVDRHDALRMRIVERAGVPRQERMDVAPVVIEHHDLTADPDREVNAQRLLQDAAVRPFDLARGTTPHVLLVRMGAEDALLLLVFHHIVFDGASVSVFFRELAQAYAASTNRSATASRKLAVQFPDYALWEREAGTEEAERATKFWEVYLAGASNGVDLSGDGMRADPAGGAGRVVAVMPSTTRAQVAALASGFGTTPFTVILAAFQALLYRYTGQKDILVGTNVSARTRAELEPLIGYLTHTLPIRASFTDDVSFGGLVEKVAAGLRGVLAHPGVSFEQLTTTRGGAPFNVLLTRQDASEHVPQLAAVAMEPVPVALATAKFDLSLSVTELADGVRVSAEFRKDVLAAERVSALLAHLEVLIASAANAPNRAVSRLELISARERDAIMSMSRGAVRIDAAASTLDALVKEQASRTPDAMVHAVDGSLTFRELDRRATLLAAMISAHVAHGGTVGMLMERSCGMVVAMLAVLRAASAYVPIDAEYPGERIRYMLDDAGVQLVLTEQRLRHLAESSPVLALDKVDWSGVEMPNAIAAPSPSDPAYMIYTSGSTGAPKGVVISHDAIVNHMRWMERALPLAGDDVVLQKTPVSFDASVWEFWAPLISGATLVLADPGAHQDPAQLVDAIQRHGVTVLQLVPSVLEELLDTPGFSQCTSLRRVLCGGESLKPAVVTRLLGVLNVEVHNLYGPAEATIDATMWSAPPAAQWTADHSVTIGRPIDNVSAYVLSAAGELQPSGFPGELVIGGRGVGLGYHNRPELTAQRFIPDPFSDRGARMYRTGDKVRWRPDGELEYLGRMDEQVKLRGVRIELGEVESALVALAGVSRAVATVRDDGRGPVLAAYVVPVAGVSLDVEAMRAQLGSLPASMVPASITVLRTLPLSPSGKVDRRALPEPAVTAAASLVSPRNDVERVVADVWRSVLKTDIGVETSFFALGGHSLLATRITAQISRIFRVALPLRRFFEVPTVAGIARVLAELEAKPGQSAAIARLFLRAREITAEERARVRDGSSKEQLPSA